MSDYMFALESHLDAGQSRIVTEVQRLATALDLVIRELWEHGQGDHFVAETLRDRQAAPSVAEVSKRGLEVRRLLA